jgi:hypothetical protein
MDEKAKSEEIMTNQKKIILLKQLSKLNFRHNFMERHTIGLCVLFRRVLGRDIMFGSPDDLINVIPELYEEGETDTWYTYWWPIDGYIIPWWKRHMAIRRTISKLKKS